METTVPTKLLTTLSQAADIVRSHDFIQVFSHYDADGVSSAAIIANALLRAGKEFRVTLFTTLNDFNMGIISRTKADCMIISDLGASYIDQLDELDSEIVVLDHHTVISEAKKVCYANPHLYGIDGMTSGCGATMSLLFAITLDEGNWDLVQLAFAGIAGDRQHINGLSGLNTYLLEQGVERGFIEEVPGSLIPAGDLMTELFLITDPYIRGVSGNAEGVSKILEDAGIKHGLTADTQREVFTVPSTGIKGKIIFNAFLRQDGGTGCHTAQDGDLVGVGVLLLGNGAHGGAGEGNGPGLALGLADESRLPQPLQVEVDGGWRFQIHRLGDLPDRGGIAMLIGKGQDKIIDLLLFGGQFTHGAAS